MLSTEMLCGHLINLVHIPIHIYEEDGTRAEIGAAEINQEDPLLCDPGFALSLVAMRNEEAPVIYREGSSVRYAVIPAKEGRTIIVGPVCAKENSKDDSKTVALLHQIDVYDNYRVHYADVITFSETVLMLFHSSSGRVLSRKELIQDSYAHYSDPAGAGAYSIMYDHRENNTTHNSYAQEVREQKAIRDGNIDALKKSWEEVQMGQVGRLGRDELTHYRNLAVVNITLASRSAIEGGVIPEVAYSLADTYTMRLQDMDDPVEIFKMFRSAEVHYAELVRDIRHGKSKNLYVRKCKVLIHNQLHGHIYEEDLAQELGITRSYLSQVFMKEEGIRLSEYILREKVKAAEHLLMYPDIPLGRIAFTFGFSSQSHFGQVFKRINGVTPGKYRELHQARK